MGVRGPRTRDAFLLKYGVNPEVLGDPGLYVYELFHALVDKERNNASGIHGIVPTLSKSIIHLWTFVYLRLIDKPFENEDTLRGHNIPFKCC